MAETDPWLPRDKGVGEKRDHQGTRGDFWGVRYVHYLFDYGDVVSAVYTHVKTHQIVYFKHVQFITHPLSCRGSCYEK